MTEIRLKQGFFLAAWGVSSILQAMGLIGFAEILQITEINFNFATIFLGALALIFSPLPDVIIIEGKRNKSLDGWKKNLAVWGGIFLSASMSFLSVYVITAMTFGGNILEWGGFAWASVGIILMMQAVIFGTELLFLDEALNEFFGHQKDSDEAKILALKAKNKMLNEQFGISDIAAEKLELLVEILNQQSKQNGATFGEIFQILAGMRNQIQTIENRPIPKLSAPAISGGVPHPNSTDEQKITWLISLMPLVEADAFTKSKLAKMWGCNSEKVSNLIEEAKTNG